ncbi:MULTISPECIES: hypothetical protein [Nostocales]|nr:hypothetical protein [Tolypothrix bouteillei]KAF3891288.1 hypothetical protein DA73_0400034345 [Tolypothrix bouteillei VB521301]
MILIRDLVRQVMMTGFLSVATEEQLRQLLRTKYDTEDLNAFMSLQEAAMAGLIRQESRESIMATNGDENPLEEAVLA